MKPAIISAGDVDAVNEIIRGVAAPACIGFVCGMFVSSATSWILKVAVILAGGVGALWAFGVLRIDPSATPAALAWLAGQSAALLDLGRLGHQFPAAICGFAMGMITSWWRTGRR